MYYYCKFGCVHGLWSISCDWWLNPQRPAGPSGRATLSAPGPAVSPRCSVSWPGNGSAPGRVICGPARRRAPHRPARWSAAWPWDSARGTAKRRKMQNEWKKQKKRHLNYARHLSGWVGPVVGSTRLPTTHLPLNWHWHWHWLLGLVFTSLAWNALHACATRELHCKWKLLCPQALNAVWQLSYKRICLDNHHHPPIHPSNRPWYHHLNRQRHEYTKRFRVVGFSDEKSWQMAISGRSFNGISPLKVILK